jgi:hypothetical protein
MMLIWRGKPQLRKTAIINGSAWLPALQQCRQMEIAKMMRSLMLPMLLFAGAAAAADTLTVEAVVSPAWLEHAGGAREPLVPGANLRDGDRVLTGSGARALLRMAEGSAIKLGENAHFDVERLADKGGAADRVVSGVLNVVPVYHRLFRVAARESQREHPHCHRDCRHPRHRCLGQVVR